MNINEFPIQLIKKYFYIYGVEGQERNRRIEKMTAKESDEFFKLYRAVVNGEISESDMKNRLNGISESGANCPLTYDQFKDIRDNDKWSLQELSDFYRQNPDLYHKYSTRYMDEIVRQKNSGIR